MNPKTPAMKPLAKTPAKRNNDTGSDSKPKTHFQTLWDEAERIKNVNRALEESLDQLVQQIRSEVGPIEMKLGLAMRTQIDKLIVFAGRKSLSQWQLHVLDEWIISTMENLDTMGLVDDALRNNLAQLQAKAYGINIDLESELSAIEQLAAGIDEQLIEIDTYFEDDDDYAGEEDEEEDFMQWYKEALAQSDMEEETEQSTRQDDHKNGRSHNSQADVEQQQTVFKKLFHRVARALHPDKEVNPEKIEAKQALMSQLLEARRQHDLVRVVQLYQEHVDDAVDFGEQELEELEKVLRQFIELESLRQGDIATKSYLHEIAFTEFYSTDVKKTNKAIARKIKQIETHKKEIETFSETVTSLQKLKPYLEKRYDQMQWSFDRFQS